MPPAAFTSAVLGLLLAVCAPVSGAAPAVTRLDGADCVSVVDAAGRLGLRLAWTSGAAPGERPGLVLFNGGHRVVLNAESRDTVIDGMRVFLGDPVASRSGRFYVSLVDYERRLIPLIRPDLCGAAPRVPRVIAIDPGHGGADSGMGNPRLGLVEKKFTLDVALRLMRLLESAGYRVVMTRTADKYVELPVRAGIANEAGADLFVSIHFNAAARDDTRTHGTEILTFPLPSQRSDQSWNEHGDDREPAAAPVNRYDVWSQVLAGCVHREVLRTLRTDDRGQKTKHLAALRSLNCPAILVESAFLSNDAEGLRVATPAFRQQIAQAFAAGIGAYAAELARLRPAGVSPSRPAASSGSR